MVVPFAGSLFYFVLFRDSLLARGMYAGVKGFTLLWPALATWLVLREHLPRPTRAAWPWRALVPGTVTGLVIVLALLGLMQTPVGAVVQSGVPGMRSKAETFGILEHYWLFALLLSTVHSLLEEYYWRWFVYGQLRQLLRLPLAHLLAGLAFAAHHIVIASQYFGLGWGVLLGGGVGVGGIIFSCLYQKQGTLLGAWAAHLLADIGILAVGHKLLFGTYV